MERAPQPQTTQTTMMDADPPRRPLLPLGNLRIRKPVSPLPPIGNLVICKHRRLASKCVDCRENTCPRGPRKCPHGRRRTQCKECGGSAICPHGRRRAQCKECGGSAICLHGLQRFRCKECGDPTAFCEHGRHFYICQHKACGEGWKSCRHGRLGGFRSMKDCPDCEEDPEKVCNHGKRGRKACKIFKKDCPRADALQSMCVHARL